MPTLEAQRLRSQITDDRVSAHEQVCAERYKTIEGKLSGLRDDMKWVYRSAIGVFLMLLGWMALQLYTLEPLRAAATLASQHH